MDQPVGLASIEQKRRKGRRKRRSRRRRRRGRKTLGAVSSEERERDEARGGKR